VIAGKTHLEILLMESWTRSRWYKTILPEEREEAMRIVAIIRRCRLSMASTGENNSMYGKSCPQQSERMMGKNNPNFGGFSKKYKAKLSASKMGEKNYMYGKKHTEEVRAKQRNAWTPEMRERQSVRKSNRIVSEETKNKMRGENNPSKRLEVRDKISKAMTGENNPNFNNWSSRAPYCYKWNGPLREEVRNRWGRICILSDMLRSVMGLESGLDAFEGHEIFDGRRLSVHHIKGNKMDGCDGTEMALIPLQNKFNTKKFDGLKLENHPFYVTLFLFKDMERKCCGEILE